MASAGTGTDLEHEKLSWKIRYLAQAISAMRNQHPI
jgi:hypothetical protein